MVLQVFADTGKVRDDADAVLPEMLTRSDAAQHEELRRVHRSARDDDLARRRRRLGDAAAPVFDAGRATALDDDARRERAGPHLEVGPAQRRPQERVGRAPARAARAPARAATLRDRCVADAFLIAAVEARDASHSVGFGRVEERVREGVRVGQAADVQRSSAARPLGPAGSVVLDATEQRKHVRPAPPRIAELGPPVVVGGAAAQIHHGVHRAAPTENPGSRPVQTTIAELRLRLGLVVPVERALEELRERGRHADLELAIPRAGLEQQHARVRILRQSRREHAARRPRADDDVVMHGMRHLGAQRYARRLSG